MIVKRTATNDSKIIFLWLTFSFAFFCKNIRCCLFCRLFAINASWLETGFFINLFRALRVGGYTVSHRECGQFRPYVHENFEKFKIISTPTVSWIRSRLRRDQIQLTVGVEIIMNFSKSSWTHPELIRGYLWLHYQRYTSSWLATCRLRLHHCATKSICRVVVNRVKFFHYFYALVPSQSLKAESSRKDRKVRSIYAWHPPLPRHNYLKIKLCLTDYRVAQKSITHFEFITLKHVNWFGWNFHTTLRHLIEIVTEIFSLFSNILLNLWRFLQRKSKTGFTRLILHVYRVFQKKLPPFLNHHKSLLSGPMPTKF